MQRAPRPGDRIVVRRRIPDTPGHLTDVIGHVVSVDPLVVRPQSVGGLPSTAATITIPAALIEILRVLPPRSVRNSDIRAIETATAAAFPGIDHRWCGEWLLRAGDGITERSNSAAPLGRSAGLTQVPLAEISEFYAQHRLPVRLLVPDRIGNPARSVCRGPQWRWGPDIVVMTRDLNALPKVHLPEGFSYRVDARPDAAWLNLYHFRGQPLPEEALRLLQTRIDGDMGFGRVCDTQGRTVAITRGTLTSSEDGRRWLGYSAVEVDAAYRRRGLGTQLGIAMLHWGAQLGADSAYLQVLAANEAGIGLYDKVGFVEHHRHRYVELVDPEPDARP